MTATATPELNERQREVIERFDEYKQRHGHYPTVILKPPPEVTDRQEEMFQWIEAFIAANHYPPTMREIGEGLGIVSPNGVHVNLHALETKGRISRRPRSARSIVVLKPTPQPAPKPRGKKS